MSEHDTLTRRLDALAARVADDDTTPPAAGDVWRAGSRRRWRERGLATAAVLAAAAVVAGLLLPGAGAPETMPATEPGVPISGYPTHISMPWTPDATDAPGRTAAIVQATDGSGPAWYAVSPRGSVRLVVPVTGAPGSLDRISVSPDGRWAEQHARITDLVHGGDAFDDERADEIATSRLPVTGDSVWSADSRQVFVAAGLPGAPPPAAGLVLTVDGSTTDVPSVVLTDGEEGAGASVSPVVAGWLDDETLLAVVDEGSGQTRYPLWTYRLGAPAWQRTGAVVTWEGSGPLPEGTVAPLGASLSPDARYLVLTRFVPPVDATGTSADTARGETVGWVFDARTGAFVGPPTPDGYAPGLYGDGTVTWQGSGCRPLWRGDRPAVVTPDGVFALGSDGVEPRLVTLSGRFDGCPAFAGNSLWGDPVDNRWAPWLERIRAVGPWVLLALGLLGVYVWRRRLGRLATRTRARVERVGVGPLR